MAQAIISTEEVVQIYNLGRPDEMLALDRVSISIESGQATVLKGPSGSGKTTLLSLIGCMSRPHSGKIMVRGRNVAKLPERFLTEIRRENFGFIFQQFQLLRDISALENVLLPLYPLGLSLGDLKDRGRALLERFSLGHKANYLVKQLSGGEQQRVAIARALINDPEIIFADEPTAHLDRKLSLEFMTIVEDLLGEGKTLVLASHDPLLYDSPLIGRTIAVRNGVVAAGLGGNGEQ